MNKLFAILILFVLFGSGTEERGIEENIYNMLSRNIVVSKAVQFYEESKDSNGVISHFESPIYPFEDGNWSFDIRLQEEHKFDSFLIEPIQLYKWDWPMCGSKSGNLTLIKPLENNVNSIYSLLSQKGLVAYRKGERQNYERDNYYFVAGDILLNQNKQIYRPKHLKRNKIFMKYLVELNYWNYSPRDIKLKSISSDSFKFCFQSPITSEEYIGEIIYENGMLKSNVLNESPK
jgi:hypothetical protein